MNSPAPRERPLLPVLQPPLPATPMMGSPLDDTATARQNVLRVISVLRRRWWVPTLLAGSAALLLLVYSLAKPPEYVASGLVQMGMYANINADPWERRSPDQNPFFETHRRLLTGNSVVEDAIRRAGMELADGPARREQRELFLRNIAIVPEKGTYLVSVEAKGSDPAAVVRRVNALMDAFIPFTHQFMGSRLAVMEQQLRDKETAFLEKLEEIRTDLEAFFTEVGTPQFEEQKNALIGSQQDLRHRLTELQIEQAVVQSDLDKAKRLLERVAQAEDVERLTGLFNKEGQTVLEERRQQVSDVRSRLVQLQATVSPDRLESLPEYDEVTSQLAAGRRALREEMREVAEAHLVALEERERTLTGTMSALKARLDESQGELDRLDRLEGRFEQIKREEQWYDKELEETRAELRNLQSRQSTADLDAMIVNRAELPTRPEPRISPVKIGFVAVLAFGLGLVLIVGWDHLDDTVSREEDVALLGLPVLGHVPHLDFSEIEELGHVRGSFWTSEAFSLIRTNLTVAAGGIQKGAIIVTSGSPRDGKSFVTLNLAASLARAGGRTLLIEADMRRPRIQAILGTDYQEGLSDVLSGQRTLDEMVQPTEFADLELLPAGPCPLNPADLLLRGQFERVIQEALEAYDHVIVDGPPARPLADASLMAPYVKGVVHVVRMRNSRRSLASGAIEQMQAVAANNLGVIVNDVGLEEAPSFRYVGYGGYGYGYYYYAPEAQQTDADGQNLFVVAPTREEHVEKIERRGKRWTAIVLALIVFLLLFGLLGQARYLPGFFQRAYDWTVGYDPAQIEPDLGEDAGDDAGGG